MAAKYNRPRKHVNNRGFKRRKNKKPKYKDFGLCVFVENGNVESALKRFRTRVEDAKIMEILHSKAYYEKPSDKKRRIRRAAK